MSGQYTDLTPQQKAAIDNTNFLVVKALISSRATLFQMQVAVLDSQVSSNGAIAALAPGASLPNEFGIKGATPVTIDQLNQMLVNFQNLLTTWNTPAAQQLHSEFVGATNLFG